MIIQDLLYVAASVSMGATLAEDPDTRPTPGGHPSFFRTFAPSGAR
jgi:hypothetical protein